MKTDLQSDALQSQKALHLIARLQKIYLVFTKVHFKTIQISVKLTPAGVSFQL